jgi:LysM repeat protein
MRSTALLFLLFSLFFAQSVRSQSDELIIQGETGKLYLLHTVVAKENWYSIGRLYNIGPKEIALYNALALDKPLNIGQELKVPLTAVNFSQSGLKPAATETLVPVFHVIQEKEWMYRISVNHNKVPIANLEKWNNINKDQVKAGMHLVVGFLKVKTAQSALAVHGGSSTAGLVAANSTATGNAGQPASKPPAEKFSAGKNSSDDKTMAIKPPADSKPAGTKPVPAPTQSAPAAAQPTVVVAQPAATPHFNGGYFSTDFSESGKSVSGPAGTFKSTSGWQDGKYYALMNNVPVGTIVRISLPSTNKTVYAKILGQLPDMKESAGLTIRISNAAAGELGEGDSKFNVEVKY